MDTNKFLVTVILFLKSSNTRKVDWVEDQLRKKVTLPNKEVATMESLSLEDAINYFKNKFVEWKAGDAVIVRENIKGEHTIISFKDVEFATFSVKLIEEEKEEKYDIKNHPAHPSNYTKGGNAK